MTAEKDKFQNGSVITISLAHLVHDIYSSFLAPILPLLIDKLGMSLSLAGLLTVVQRIPALCNFVIGMVADKLPVRYILILAPSLTAISMSLIGSAPHYIVLMILLFISGIGSALFHVPAPVMIKQVSGNRIGKGMSFFMLGGEGARSLAPIIILGAISYWGLEGTYKLIPFGLFCSFLLYLRFKNIPISKNFKKSESDAKMFDTFKKSLPIFAKIMGIIFFTSLLKSALTTFLPTFITSQGSSLWAGGISLSILQLSGAAGTFLSGTISDKIGRKRTLLIMATVTPLLMWAFLFLDKVFAIPILLLAGFFMFASTPVLLAIVNNIETEHPSFLNGVYMTFNFVFGALAVWLVGFLGDTIGLELTYQLAPIMGLLAIPFILKLSTKN